MDCRLNKEWHRAHLMPKNATEEERLQWHLEHAKNCRCRPFPQKLIDDLERFGLSTGRKTSLR